jgi:hypothetical protein
VVTTEKAETLLGIAGTPIAIEPEPLQIRGILSAADASAATFKVRMDDDFPRPEGIPPQTRYIEGSYNSAAREAVEKHSLWNARVIATVIATRAQYADRIYPTITGFAFESIAPFGS